MLPELDFDSYLDGENITDQDLVAWVSMGIIHVPRGALQAASLLTGHAAVCAALPACQLHSLAGLCSLHSHLSMSVNALHGKLLSRSQAPLRWS